VSPKTVSHCSARLLGLLDFETSTLDLETCTLKFPRGARRETENVENENRDTVRRVNNVLRRDGNSQRVDRRTEILGQSAETLGESPKSSNQSTEERIRKRNAETSPRNGGLWRPMGRVGAHARKARMRGEKLGSGGESGQGQNRTADTRIFSSSRCVLHPGAAASIRQ